MKETFKYLSLFFVAILLSCTFTACGSDDDDDDPVDPATHDSALIGTWVYSDSGSDWSETLEATFKANGTFTMKATYWEKDYGKETITSSGEWATSNGYLVVVIKKSNDPDMVGETESGYYTVNGRTATFNGDTYTKK